MTVRYARRHVKSAPVTKVKFSGAKRKYTRKTLGPKRQRKARLTKKNKTSKKMVNDGVVSQSYSNIPLGNKKNYLPKHIYRLTGRLNYVKCEGNQFTWDVSRQNSEVGGYYFTNTDIQQIFNQISSGIGGITSNNITYKVYLEDLTADLLITNQTNDVVHLVIYDVVARQNISDDNYDNPVDCWENSNTTFMNNSDMFFQPGSTPFQNPTFCKKYKVTKVTDIQLNTGGHHEHRVKIKCNRILSYDDWNTVSGSGNSFQNLSAFSILTCHGFPVDNGTSVGTASGKVTYATTKSYDFRYIQNNISFVSYNNNLVQIAPTSQNIISDLVGSSVTIDTA